MAVKINEKAANLAVDWIKQIITLSSGIIVFSAAFTLDILAELTLKSILLITAWICFISSIILGLDAISNIIKSFIDDNNEWANGPCKKKAKWTKFLFISGLLFFIIVAIIHLF